MYLAFDALMQQTTYEGCKEFVDAVEKEFLKGIKHYRVITSQPLFRDDMVNLKSLKFTVTFAEGAAQFTLEDDNDLSEEQRTIFNMYDKRS